MCVKASNTWVSSVKSSSLLKAAGVFVLPVSLSSTQKAEVNLKFQSTQGAFSFSWNKLNYTTRKAAINNAGDTGLCPLNFHVLVN